MLLATTTTLLLASIPALIKPASERTVLDEVPSFVSLVVVVGAGPGLGSALDSEPLLRAEDFATDPHLGALFYAFRLGFENRAYVEFRRSLFRTFHEGPEDPDGMRRPERLLLRLTTTEGLLAINPLWGARPVGVYVLAGGGTGAFQSLYQESEGWNVAQMTWGVAATLHGNAHPVGIGGGFGMALEVRHARLTPRNDDLGERFHHTVTLTFQAQFGFGFTIGSEE